MLRQAMIIDDSDPDLLYTQVVLDRAQVAEEVLTFGAAQDALAFLQRPEGHHVDVILLDINMPEMNGFEFLEAYEKLHAAQKARAVVVMLTSSPDPNDRARAASFGCVVNYIIKPIDLASASQLLEVVASVSR